MTSNLPKVRILGTGGTIAGAAEAGPQSAYRSGVVTIDSMLSAIPGVHDLAIIRGEQFANIGSQDMTMQMLLELAKRCNQLLASTEVDGIVITHGTDTMEETAFFLNLVVKSSKPVVLVGSMRPPVAMSADGPLNLFNAIGVAVDPDAGGRGVLVVMNDWIHGARSFTKMSTTAVHASIAPLRGLVGVARYGKNDFYGTPPRRHTVRSQFDIHNVTEMPRVDILHAHVDMAADLVDASVANGSKGIVVAGLGNGNMNDATLQAARRAARQGVTVVRSSRVATGAVVRNVEINDDEMGFVVSDDLNPQQARMLLMLALLEPCSTAGLQQMFYTY